MTLNDNIEPTEDEGRMGVEERLMLHLGRFLAPICQARVIYLDTSSGQLRSYLDGIALTINPARGSVETMILLGQRNASQAQHNSLLPELTPEGILIQNNQTEQPSHRFRYQIDVESSPISGTIISNAAHTSRRVVVLQEKATAVPAPQVKFSVYSDVPICGLEFGIFEVSTRGRKQKTDTPPNRAPLPAMEADAPVIRTTLRAWSRREFPSSEIADQQTRIALLGNRLLKVEERVFGLLREKGDLQRKLEQLQGISSHSDAHYFDIPRLVFDWLLASDQSRTIDQLDKYDRRVDDVVVIAGRKGQEYFRRFRLLTETPDFSGAVAGLNREQKRLNLISEVCQDRPDVSIIIPVYGQLPYTLNCLHSLFEQTSRYTAEIIVVDDRSQDGSSRILQQIHGIRYHLQPTNKGFIASCNTGGERARGRYVLMLNNDTRVTDGWLDSLIDSFGLFPKAGMVGSKLCYQDGTLQEAGGIIWRDGSCWNYGRNDDPNRPQYSYARRVDYISGCSIAIPSELWRQLNGFDPYYSPAYCEDADFSLRVKSAGYEVWLQPQSRLVHYEGKTSGVDTAQGVKAYQLVNTRKLFLRWRTQLELHRPNGEAPFFERERSVHRRMLVVDATVPTPKQDAGSVQTVICLHTARSLGYKVSFVPEDNWLFQSEHTGPLQAAGIDCAYAPYEVGFENYIRRYGWMFDVVLVYRVHTLARIYKDIREFAPQAALLFHVADLHFLRLQREAILAGDEVGLRVANEVKELELRMVQSVDCTITHSRVEAQILDTETPGAPAIVWPLMFEFFGTNVPFHDRSGVCFLGGYRHSPNVDAVIFFVRDVLPLIVANEPGICFTIAGYSPTEEVLALEGPNVKVVGPVEDLRDLFDAARVFVCPLRVGAGVKGKIISALAYGIPVVSTSIGVEGTDLLESKHCLVADTQEELADATLRVYRDRTIWDGLSRAGQAFVRDELSESKGRVLLSQAIDLAYKQKFGMKEGLSASGLSGPERKQQVYIGPLVDHA